MQVRQIGDYNYKGTRGMYVRVIGSDPAQYAAIDWATLPDVLLPAIRRGEAFEVPDTETSPRIDECLGE